MRRPREVGSARPGRALVVAICLLALALPGAASQDDPAGGERERVVTRGQAEAVIEAAIQALGGPKYLAVTSMVSRGVFAAYQQGRPGIPTEFVDTIVYPDRNRTDFGKKKKNRVVQANAGDRGWKIDAARSVLVAQTPEEVRGFQRYVRANIDNVLRRGWREPGAQLRHLGRVEYAPRRWAEVVEVEYPDGLKVELLFDPRTHLPVASRYREGAESGASGSLLETRYHEPYLDYGGVKVARTVDLFRDGVQTARVIYETVELNAAVEPGYFDQPANIKDIKDLK